MNRVILCQPKSMVVKTGQAAAGWFAVLDGECAEAKVLMTFQRFKLYTFVPMIYEYQYIDGKFNGATRVMPQPGLRPFQLNGIQFSYRYHTLGWLPRRREFVEYVSVRPPTTVSVLGIRSRRSLYNDFYEDVTEYLPLPLPPAITGDEVLSKAISQLPPAMERTRVKVTPHKNEAALRRFLGGTL